MTLDEFGNAAHVAGRAFTAARMFCADEATLAAMAHAEQLIAHARQFATTWETAAQVQTAQPELAQQLRAQAIAHVVQVLSPKAQ